MVIGTVVYEAALNALRRLAQEHHSARQFDRERGAERIEGSTKGGRTKTRGTILEIQPPRRLVHSHWSPVSGLPDAPENHELVTWELDEREGETELTIKEANLSSEEAKATSEKSWRLVLENLKRLLEE